jgi:type IV pilus assembly protein PilE
MGFTLIELMITVAVIAILTAVAMPSYRHYVTRSKRTAAQAAMMDLANREQQYLIANRVFADTTALTTNGYALPEEVRGGYTWAVTTSTPSNGPPTFLITLTPIGAQAHDGPLTLNEQSVKTPVEKWQR